MNRGRGFRIKEYANSRRRSCLGDPTQIIASGDGSRIYRFAENISECLDAPRPLFGQFLLTAMGHPLRMRKRVAANHVSSFSQATNLLCVQKARLADLPGSNKKVPAPSMFIEEIGDAGGGAFAAVVEGQKERKFFSYICEFMRCAGRELADLCDCRQMGFEFGPAQFVFRSSWACKSAGIPVSLLDDVVIEQTHGSQRRLLFA
jgi:hypothetical protein